MKHYNRQNDQTLERQLSPQRLVHYRDNWYLDAWCHLRNDLRSFSVDALTEVHVLGEAGQGDQAEWSWIVCSGRATGFLRGAPKAWATLQFTPERARWVRGEMWHPQQETREMEDGGFEVSVPYSDERELMGEVLRFGPDVKVKEPAELRRKVQQAALATVNRYV